MPVRSPPLCRAAVALVAVFAAGLAAWSVPAAAGDRSITILEGDPESITAQPEPAGSPIAGLALTADNPAGLTLDILPNGDLPLGTQVAFVVTTQRPGYLLLVDINADHRATQIYPSLPSLAQPIKTTGPLNLIKPGNPVRVPNLRDPLANFMFRAEAPAGRGIMVAILSEIPVQIIDAPQIPASASEPQAMVDALVSGVQTLQVASATNDGSFVPGRWSFVAKPYVIH